jgi:hypothetical protein
MLGYRVVDLRAASSWRRKSEKPWPWVISRERLWCEEALALGLEEL